MTCNTQSYIPWQ